jgi:hypothetical protein
MKRSVYILLVLLVITHVNGYCQKGKEKLRVKADTSAVDSVEYKLIVIDPGFESWLVTRPPVSFYSKEYYEIKNRFYVKEWNLRHDDPMRFGDLYETKIDYDGMTDYGLKLNYRLYNYFVYFEETNHVKLIGTGR